MGAKTCMLVYAAANAREVLKTLPALDRDAAARLAATLFPGEKLEPMPDGSLADTSLPERELGVGCFPGVSIVAAKEFGIDRPSTLPARFVEAGRNGIVVLHAMHSVVDWFAYARWENGRLTRSLSLSPDSGILEDIGPRLAFEAPFWSGQRPAVADEEDPDAYPFPFHPLDLGEAALAEFFGYVLEGPVDAGEFDPESVPLSRFRRMRSRWKFW